MNIKIGLGIPPQRRPPVASMISPSDVAGLALWFDPSDAANRVIDQAGGFDQLRSLTNKANPGVHDAVNTDLDENQDPSTAPGVSTINGLTVLDLHTTPGWLDLKTAGILAELLLGQNPAVSIMAVLSLAGNATGYYLSAENGSSTIPGISAGKDRTYIGGQLTDLGNYPGQYVASTPQIREVVRAAGASQPIAVYRNGVLKSAGTAGSTGATCNIGAVGCSESLFGVAAWNGLIGEILVYTTALATVDRQLLESYLSTKWGIALA